MKTDIISLDNKSVGDIDLDETVFGIEVRRDILARMVNYQLAKRRSGNHKVKQRSEIKGTTAKPFRQKGTGRARQGSRKAPQLRGGGVVFGPVVRSHAHDLPKKVRKLALRTALSSKQADGKLVVLDSTAIDTPKTKDLVSRLTGLGWDRALVVDGAEVNGNFAKAAGNIPSVDVLPSQGANVYDILRCDTLVLTKDAVAQLVERLK
ncbi:50S ribosomal protein L4 [Magnetospira sp. QH-2]|uniref:50S ribosomal protein L4 n=1 Tax=Magnetospira sp. (strain QH-2) TaxID=1288970 RepID=UPI0003E817BC|nr:50S ribosomal protein L4 [Magnetospira sp. QH-2]CCQ74605.1 50S ribosomal subunit protein L4 [Magnetospira sp. QH-2]